MGELQSDSIDLAFVLSPDLTFSFERRGRPSLKGSKDVIVEVVATGLCGSDVSREVYHHTDCLLMKTVIGSLLATRSDWRLQSCRPNYPRTRIGWYCERVWNRCDKSSTR